MSRLLTLLAAGSADLGLETRVSGDVSPEEVSLSARGTIHPSDTSAIFLEASPTAPRASLGASVAMGKLTLGAALTRSDGALTSTIKLQHPVRPWLKATTTLTAAVTGDSAVVSVSGEATLPKQEKTTLSLAVSVPFSSATEPADLLAPGAPVAPTLGLSRELSAYHTFRVRLSKESAGLGFDIEF